MLEFRPVPHPRSAPAPAVAPRVRQCRSISSHRARGSDVAALAFALPLAVPAQRRPDPAESLPAG